MIELNQVSKYYDGIAAVSQVSFSVPQGELLVLLGTSGSGKTTTLKMINRLIEKDSGSIMINGEDINKLHPHLLRRKIGYVIQQVGLFPHYSIAKNIALVPELLGWTEDRIKKRVNTLLDLIGLNAEVKNRLPHELSGGQQQRVGLARALASDPELILMDEPFGALDPITRQAMQKELKELQKSTAKTIILVTHDVKEAFILADRICLMDKGNIQQCGSPKELLYKPSNTFVRAFFESSIAELELLAVKLFQLAPFLNDLVKLDGETATLDHEITLKEAYDQNRFKAITFSYEGQDFIVSKDDLLRIFYSNKRNITL